MFIVLFPLNTHSVRQIVVISVAGIQCHTLRGVVVSDGVLRDVTTNAAFALGLSSDSPLVRFVEPSSTTFIVIEEESMSFFPKLYT